MFTIFLSHRIIKNIEEMEPLIAKYRDGEELRMSVRDPKKLLEIKAELDGLGYVYKEA